MWRTVLVLPLCTLIVAVFSARSTSATPSCECGGPSEDSPANISTISTANPALCDIVTISDCIDPEPHCYCSPRQRTVIPLDNWLDGTWWCLHNNVGECVECTENDHCAGTGEICCPEKKVCEVPIPDSDPAACGDPHMTGFLGQKFDFAGEDGAWYCLVNDGPSMHLNMRVTAPVPAVPQITYITGLSVITTDVQGVDHTIEITVSDPHNMDTSCPEGFSPCLADGALTVKLDGHESLVSPGEVTLGPGVAISAVNLPGSCRSFGFEKYWEHKKLQNAGGVRRLDILGFMQDMGEWILADPTATNMAECTEYVAAAGDNGLFEHESEHASFQIMTPIATVRLSHGKLHQLAERDPTDQFDLPEHLTWQMNVAIDHYDVSYEATGVLGETVVPTVDANGKYIMKGMDAIRGSQEDFTRLLAHAVRRAPSTGGQCITKHINAGVNYQGNGELNWDGRVLPDLEFWQMDVGIDGLGVDNPSLSGLLGETAHPVYDENGKAIVEGLDAFRGTVEDYRVSGALGVNFPLLDAKE